MSISHHRYSYIPNCVKAGRYFNRNLFSFVNTCMNSKKPSINIKTWKGSSKLKTFVPLCFHTLELSSPRTRKGLHLHSVVPIISLRRQMLSRAWDIFIAIFDHQAFSLILKAEGEQRDTAILMLYFLSVYMSQETGQTSDSSWS